MERKRRKEKKNADLHEKIGLPVMFSEKVGEGGGRE